MHSLQNSVQLNEKNDPVKNTNFTQTTPKGWHRMRQMLKTKDIASAVPLYMFFAEHIDPYCGAVIADQGFLATHLGVSIRTIQRWLSVLETNQVIVRIPVAGRVCAYALDPNEVWKGYNTSKDYAAFVTKTLTNKDGEIKRRIATMIGAKEEYN